MAARQITDRKKRKKYIRWFWSLLLAGFFSLALLIGLVAAGAFGSLPSFEELENPKSNLASEIYTADLKLLGTYFKENRTNVSYQQLSPHLVQALIATEDERFFDHSGIDFRGLARAVVYLGKRGGASTITQQLAKNLFPRDRLSKFQLIIRKLKEWIIALKLERQYTKDEIITMYFNTIDFVNNAVGVKSASSVYFDKPPDSLRLEEAATLVGMLQNPSLYNPVKRPDTTLYRRNVVLGQLLRNNRINLAEFDSLKKLPLTLNYRKVDHKEGVAPYFREVLRERLKELFLEISPGIEKYLYSKPDGSPYDIYKDGLKIYTTIDSRLQDYAEWAVKEHLGKELQKEFQKELQDKKNAPFDWRVSKKEIDLIMETAMKRTQRYRVLTGQECGNCNRRGKYISRQKENGREYYVCAAPECAEYRKPVISTAEVETVFNTPVQMTVFSWNGELDTVMSPMDSIRYYKSYLQAGFMSMDPHTGFIKAWVGGIDYKHFQFDHVMQSRRQVGSTFKPFVYALAMQEKIYPPCHEVPNVKTCFDLPDGRVWCPKNSDGEYGGMVSIEYGLANSINTVTAHLMKQLGPLPVCNLARRMGITSPLDPVPSLCLGVADLSVYELVGANCTFANKGVWLEPVFISRIEDKNGNVIYNFREKQKVEKALSEETAYIMLEMMKAVVDGAYNREKKKSLGTAMRLRYGSRPYSGHTYPIAAKTGTTQNQSDGWFIGITPDLVSGGWVGAEDRSVRFSRLYFGQGANMALPIWGYYMQKVQGDKSLNFSKGDFEKYTGPLWTELNCKKFWKEEDSFGYGKEDFGK